MLRFKIHLIYLSKAYNQLKMLKLEKKIFLILTYSNSVDDDKEPQVIKSNSSY